MASNEEENNLVAVAARRTESLDTPRILALMTNDTEKVFGRLNVVQLIEKANLAVTLLDESSIIIGHAAFVDYPGARFTSNSEWEVWIRKYYKEDKFSPLNTLFLRCFVSKEDFKQGSLNEILRTVFSAIPFLHFIVLVTSADVELGQHFAKVFKNVPYADGVNAEEVQHKMYMCQRHDFCPILYIRTARVEDHDDLMPIFDQHNNRLREIYGDFFLSELIEAQNKDNKALVADVDGTAVGFISITTDVNMKILSECFELGPFNELKSRRIIKKDTSKTVKLDVDSHQTEDDDRPESVLSKSSAAALSTVSSSSPTSEKGRTLRSPAKAPKRLMRIKSPLPSKADLENTQSTTPQPETTLLSPHDQELVQKQASLDQEHGSKEETSADELSVMIPSAMCIQLFCIDERFEMRSVDFLAAVFEAFPDKDFCIISIPHTVPEFPLLQLFKRVTPKPDCVLSQELYVFHRCGLLREFSVRPCRSEDQQGINKLLMELHAKTDLLSDITQFNKARRDEDGTPIQAYVAECQKQIVGVCVLRQEEQIEYIRAQYNIEDFIYFNQHERQEHGRLFHFVLNPIFSHYNRHFMKEILRLSNKSCLYFLRQPPCVTVKSTKPNSIVTCLPDLVPIKARRQIVYPLEELDNNAPSERVLKKEDGYSLYHVNRKLTFEPKVVINVRIVIVGGSDTGISCLESLAFCPHLRFNNLTLITPDPLPEDKGSDNQGYAFFPTQLCNSREDFVTMALGTWVHVVHGKVVKINRSNKVVYTSSGKKVPYDHLLLCTGQQFQLPVPTGVDISELVTTPEAMKRQLPQVYTGFLPKNVFLLNSPTNCRGVIDWVTDEAAKTDGNVLVYGASLEAYVCIQALLSCGISGPRINLVKPPSSGNSCFNNPYVEKRVEEALERHGIVVHSNYTLAQWNDGKNDEPDLFSASFTSDTKPIRIHCKGFFCFQEKKVDYSIFKAINDSCLVYDGKLVIDSCFRTNDPLINAAGPMTKYARRYHADQWSHANFNSKEIGSKLADAMLQFFDPTLEGQSREDPLDDKLIPVFRAPKCTYTVIPGGFHYLHVSKPSLQIPLESLMAQPDFGKELITDTSKGDHANYFRLHINQYKFVETITCLRSEPFDVSNLVALYGVHERYLNNLVTRFDEGLITDFYKFFQEPWCLAIYHDRFQDFRTEVRELLAAKEPSTMSLEEKVIKMVEEDLMLSKEQKEYLQDSFVSSGTKKAIEERLLSFLSYNDYHLPMYAKPGMI